MHVAKLVAITAVKDVPPDILPFVEFRAAVEERALDPDEMVALLVIDTTTSYIPVFLADSGDITKVETMLAAQEARLSPEAKEVLTKHIGT
jgi:hypothetical protein